MKGYVDLIVPTEDAGNIFRALEPELEDDLIRSKVKLAFDSGSVRLKVEGDDTVSIRAALNTWLRLVKIAFEIKDI
jgi:KEOPS complex subunit Pcc1